MPGLYGDGAYFASEACNAHQYTWLNVSGNARGRRKQGWKELGRSSAHVQEKNWRSRTLQGPPTAESPSVAFFRGPRTAHRTDAVGGIVALLLPTHVHNNQMFLCLIIFFVHSLLRRPSSTEDSRCALLHVRRFQASAALRHGAVLAGLPQVRRHRCRMKPDVVGGKVALLLLEICP